MGTKKSFDAVQMVRNIRDAHHEQVKEMSLEDRLAFYRKKSRALRTELLNETERKAG